MKCNFCNKEIKKLQAKTTENHKISFIIPGEPAGKARARVTRNGTYTPEKTVLYENLVKIMYYQSKGNYIEGPINITIEAFFKIPDSYSKKKINQCLLHEIYPTKKPDFDNIEKIITDSINGKAYKDDSYIVESHTFKRWTDKKEGYVKVTLSKKI